jgi:hypothetical protein
MNEFIINAAKHFAKIINAGTGNFQDLNTLKERFDKELSAYKSYDSRKDFLQQLEIELKLSFQSHFTKCDKKTTCPQHLTFQNTTFLISEESKEERLSTLLLNNSEYDSILNKYKNKVETTKIFLEKEKFIKEEIDRIKTIFLNRSTSTSFSSGTLIGQFDYSRYSKYAYDWLMSGHDWVLSQILKNAKSNYEQSMGAMPDEKEFEKIIHHYLKEGVAYVLYEKFLTDQLKTINQSAKVSKPKTRQAIPFRVKALLQKEISSTCPFCDSEDVDIFEIHHIDENRENNVFGNLIMLCPSCHSKITKRNILRNEVVRRKNSLKK